MVRACFPSVCQFPIPETLLPVSFFFCFQEANYASQQGKAKGQILRALVCCKRCTKPPKFTNAKRALANDTRIIKIYAMVELMTTHVCNVWAISTCFDLPDMFFLTSLKVTADFAYITPSTMGTGYLINDVRLMFKRRSEIGSREFFLQSLEGLSFNLNVVPSRNSY